MAVKQTNRNFRGGNLIITYEIFLHHWFLLASAAAHLTTNISFSTCNTGETEQRVDFLINGPHRQLIASRTWLHHHNVAQRWHIHVLDAYLSNCTMREVNALLDKEPCVVTRKTTRGAFHLFSVSGRLFMSGCMYSREGMASYGGPIHILFASYDGLPA